MNHWVTAAAVGDTFARQISGSLALAIPIAMAAGLVSFLSPCVLPLVPGYLSYVTGLTGADLEEGRRGRMLAGALLFVLGFSFVFVSAGLAFGSLGRLLQEHAVGISRVLGVVTIGLGLSFMGVLPPLTRDIRIHRAVPRGLLAAPALGVLFGLGWTPCVGPTLTAVQTLAFTQASAVKGAALSFAYCLGLGIPFVLAALAMRRALGAFAVVKRHYRAVTAVGGAFLVAIGLMLVTGVWNDVTIYLRHWVPGFTPVV